MDDVTQSFPTELASPEAKVIAIFTYPIKSCPGISLPNAPLTPFGFRRDRQWVVVNSKGRACTQRVDPKLALVEVQLPPEAFLPHWEPTTDSFMVLKALGREPLKVCLKKQYEVVDDITVWEWNGSAWDEGAEASQWFSDYLEKPSKLVRFNSASGVRNVDPDYVEGQQQTFFSDGYPFLLLSQNLNGSRYPSGMELVPRFMNSMYPSNNMFSQYGNVHSELILVLALLHIDLEQALMITSL